MAYERVLVTGADGFIGSHLVEALVRRGHAVRALVQYNSFNTWGWLDSLDTQVLQNIEVVTGDIRDGGLVRTLVRGCDTIFHLAALIAIPYSYQAPSSYIETNVQGTLNVLEAVRDLDAARLIHTSTSEVYGTARFVPITEEHPLQTQSPYAASKAAADHLALAFHLSFGTPVTVIRPFNTYGPRQSARAVIPTIITQILAGRRQLHLGSVHPTRDFNFIKDTVEGFITVGASPHALGQVINIGSNFEISIGEVVEVVAEVIGVDLEVLSDDARIRPAASEVERLWADNTKARTLTGWTPAYGDRDGFKRGITETVAWFRETAEAGRYKVNLYNV